MQSKMGHCAVFFLTVENEHLSNLEHFRDEGVVPLFLENEKDKEGFADYSVVMEIVIMVVIVLVLSISLAIV